MIEVPVYVVVPFLALLAVDTVAAFACMWLMHQALDRAGEALEMVDKAHLRLDRLLAHTKREEDA